MDMNPTNPENREALLQELVLRLTISPFDPRTQNPQLFLGQLPDNLPFELPIPEGSRVIGGVARSPEHIDILLDVPLPPDQALAFYKERLQAAGWSELDQPMGMERGGFVHTAILAQHHNVYFCKGSRGPSLHFSAIREQAGFTDVRLSLNLDERESPCAHSARMRKERMTRGMGFEQLIPPLAPPEGARQMGGGGGGGSDSWYSTATLEVGTDLATLTAHYANQLARGGWTRIDEGASGPCAWHTWTFQDEEKEPWYGMFFMLKLPGKEREYFLYIRIELADRHSGPKPGGFSFAPLSGGSWTSYGSRK